MKEYTLTCYIGTQFASKFYFQNDLQRDRKKSELQFSPGKITRIEENTEDGVYLSRYDLLGNMVQFTRYRVFRETPKCYVIEVEGVKPKFVLKNSVKKFAYLSKGEALYSFKRRCEIRLRHLKEQTYRVKEALRIVDTQGLRLYDLLDYEIIDFPPFVEYVIAEIYDPEQQKFVKYDQGEWEGEKVDDIKDS